MERNYIMQIICEATQSNNDQIKVSALQNLVKIMNLYYEYMEAYMGQALFAITVAAMKSPNDDVALQGIEFWSSVCEEESELQIELTEAMEEGRSPDSHVTLLRARRSPNTWCPFSCKGYASKKIAKTTTTTAYH